MCSRSDDPSMLYVELRGTIYNTIGGDYQTVTVQVEGMTDDALLGIPMGAPAVIRYAAAALAASATDEGPGGLTALEQREIAEVLAAADKMPLLNRFFATLAARPAAPALDVERLARAMEESDAGWPVRWQRADFEWVARQVDAKYARTRKDDRD